MRRHVINIAHGLYPRAPFDEIVLQRLVNHLSSATRVTLLALRAS
jgi:hypothetical protein